MVGAFYFGGIDMAIHKCRKCIWSNKISSNLLYCIFPRCIAREETVEKVTTEKETTVLHKARTTCDDKWKRRKRNVSKKTTKAL